MSLAKKITDIALNTITSKSTSGVLTTYCDYTRLLGGISGSIAATIYSFNKFECNDSIVESVILRSLGCPSSAIVGGAVGYFAGPVIPIAASLTIIQNKIKDY